MTRSAYLTYSNYAFLIWIQSADVDYIYCRGATAWIWFIYKRARNFETRRDTWRFKRHVYQCALCCYVWLDLIQYNHVKITHKKEREKKKKNICEKLLLASMSKRTWEFRNRCQWNWIFFWQTFNSFDILYNKGKQLALIFFKKWQFQQNFVSLNVTFDERW